MRFASLAILSLLAATPVQAEGLTIRTGETWIFSIENGQPVRPRKVEPATKPGKNEVQVAVRSMFGTALSMGGQVDVSYTYRAELIRGGKRIASRSCALPARGKPVFEYWKESAEAVRISNFKPAPAGSLCP